MLLVIVQKSKGGGLASPFASTNNIMGVRKTTDVLEKATWWLFGIVAVLCIASSHFLGTGSDADSKTQQVLEQNAAKGAAPTALPALGGGAAPRRVLLQQLPLLPQKLLLPQLRLPTKAPYTYIIGTPLTC